MYKKHCCFNEPYEDTRIWRYMDFAKFMSLITSQTLYFCRVDNFEDNFEGRYAKPNYDLNLTIKKLNYNLDSEKKKNKARQIIRIEAEEIERNRKQVYINCWHMDENDAYTMWKIYSNLSTGIAIQSTVKRLKNSLDCDYVHYIGKVDYEDYNLYEVPEHNMFNPFLVKQQFYSYENELRVVIDKHIREGNSMLDNKIELPKGLNSKIKDINELIEKVYLAPKAEKWFGDLVKEILKKYEIYKEVQQSQILSYEEILNNL